MASLFNTQGNMQSNPQLALNKNQNTNAGLFQQPKQSNILSGMTIPEQPNTQSSGLTQVGGNNAGMIPTTPHPAVTPSTPVKSIQDGSGNTMTFHAPKVVAPDDPANMYNTQTGAKNPNYKDPNAPTPTTTTPPAPTIGGQPATVAGQAQNVLNQSTLNNNPEYQNLAKQQGILTAAQNNASEAGVGGENTLNPTDTANLGNSYSNLFLPQTTSNLAGEKGLLSPYLTNTEAANTAEASRLLAGGQLATQGAENVLGSVNTQVSPGNTLVNQATNSGVYGLGTGAGGNGGNALTNFQNLNYNNANANALAKQGQDLQTGANLTDKNFTTLQQAMTSGGLNPTNFPTINAWAQAVDKQLGGAGNTSALAEAYNALKTSLSSVIGSSTNGLTPTDITGMLNNQNFSTLSPSQLLQVMPTVQKTMNDKINTIGTQAYQAEQAGTNFNNGTGNVGGSGNPYEDMVQ